MNASNASDLAKRWLVLVQPTNRTFNFGKWCGVLQNLLKKYNSEEISNAMDLYHYYYPFSTSILGFASYCKRMIKYNRTKKSKSKEKV